MDQILFAAVDDALVDEIGIAAAVVAAAVVAVVAGVVVVFEFCVCVSNEFAL